MPRSSHRSRFSGPEEVLVIAHQVDETTKMLKRLVARLVIEANDRGATWEEIGQVFGVSRQTVHERFGPNGRALRRGDRRG